MAFDQFRGDPQNRFRGMHESQLRPPIELDFLGWRSDTHRLQQHGWQFAESMSRDVYTMMDEWRIEMKHPEYQLSGMSHPIQFHRLWEDYHSHGSRRMNLKVHLGQIMVGGGYDMRQDMFPVDASMNMERRYTHDPYDVYHQPYFRAIDDSKDVFLRKATVAEIMDIALSKQEPDQERIREEMRRSKDLAGIRGEERARLIMVA